MRKLLNKRFTFLSYPADLLRNRTCNMRKAGVINDRAARTFYPIRGVRYWWVLCALIIEASRRQRRIRVADVGCSKGSLKNFVGDDIDAEWIGLDKKIDSDTPGVVGYSELYECDFDKPLPVPDNSIDIVVFLHVIEHLPRPSFTMGELSRILRPGGLMLGGSPVAPKPVAWARERQLRSRLRRGEVEAGGHINSMDCSRWRILVKNSGLNLDMMTGTFLVRWSGSPLENQAWWLRLNQIWGAFFPSLGGEIYLSARKPSSEGLISAKDLPARTSMPSMWKRGLAGAFIVFIVFFGIFIFDVKWGQKGPVAAAVMKHQDGNDVFYTVKHPAMNKAIKEKIVIELYHPDDIVQTVDIDRKSGKDSHFFVPSDSLSSLPLKHNGLGIAQK